MTAGWQQPAVTRPQPQRCVHLGAFFAAMAVGLHDVGHEWVCPCGKAFVVVQTPDGKKLTARR